MNGITTVFLILNQTIKVIGYCNHRYFLMLFNIPHKTLTVEVIVLVYVPWILLDRVQLDIQPP